MYYIYHGGSSILCLAFLNLNATNASVERRRLYKMAETHTLHLREIPSRTLRKKVRVFLHGGDVSVEVESGSRYEVELQSSTKIVLRPLDACAL